MRFVPLRDARGPIAARFATQVAGQAHQSLGKYARIHDLQLGGHGRSEAHLRQNIALDIDARRNFDQLQTLRSDIDYGFAEARTTYGIIGIKVWIYKGQKVGK